MDLIMHLDSSSLVLQSATTPWLWMSYPPINTAMITAARSSFDPKTDEVMWHTSSGPSAKDWEFHRRTITQLYQIEERTLKDVKAIMEAGHGFSATDKMYKSKFTLWDVRKNYTKAEKAAACRIVKRKVSLGKDNTEVMIRGKPMKPRRIYRYITNLRRGLVEVNDDVEIQAAHVDIACRSPRMNELCPASKHKEVTRRRQDFTSHFHHYMEILRPIYPSGDEQYTEVICFQCVALLDSSRTSSTSAFGIDNDYPSWVPTLVQNAHWMAKAQRYRDARMTLNRLGDRLRELLHRPLLELLPILLHVYSHHSLEVVSEFNVTQIWLDHAIELCKLYLGLRHPVTVVLTLLPRTNSALDVCSSALLAMRAKTKAYSASQRELDLKSELLHRHVSVLRSVEKFDEAETVSWQAIEICEKLFGDRHVKTLRRLSRLGWTLRNGKDFDGAADVFWKVLERGTDPSTGTINSYAALAAYTGLGEVARDIQDLDQAEDAYRKALAYGMKIWESDDNTIVTIAEQLEYVLRAQGKEAEAEQIRKTYELQDEFDNDEPLMVMMTKRATATADVDDGELAPDLSSVPILPLPRPLAARLHGSILI